MESTTIASGTPGATIPYTTRRLAALCGAAIAAAIFTPVPATADAGPPAVEPTVMMSVPASAQQAQPSADRGRSADLIAQSLISTGTIGIGLALSGIVIVSHRRRQW
jgi:hypothetical protein